MIMYRSLWTIAVVATLGCQGRDTGARTSRSPISDSQLIGRVRSAVRITSLSDSLVMAALARPGAQLEYRWVVEPAAAEAPGRRRVVDPQSGRSLVLDDTVVLDLSRVQSVAPSHLPDPQHSAVILNLDMANADRLMSNTNRHLGRQLVITLNDQVLATPIIRTPFGSSIPAAHDLDSGVALQLAVRLRAALPARVPPLSRRHLTRRLQLTARTSLRNE